MPTSHQVSLFASPDESASRADDVRRLKTLAEEVLPEKAASGDYPVRFDHCFKRIAYDVAVGTQWDTEVAPPFYQHATPDQLRRAIAVLWEMIGDPDRAATYNQQSLRYRDVRA
ncbi:MAG: GCN5-related N-acetyltransferase [Salinibacter sp.]